MRRSRGTSLIEALVASVILATGLLVVFNLFPKGAESLAFHEMRMNAATLGESLLSRARADGYDAVAPSRGQEVLQGVFDGRPSTRTVDYEVQVEDAGQDRKRVRAVMTWAEKSGRGELVVETQVLKRGRS